MKEYNQESVQLVTASSEFGAQSEMCFGSECVSSKYLRSQYSFLLRRYLAVGSRKYVISAPRISRASWTIDSRDKGLASYR